MKTKCFKTVGAPRLLELADILERATKYRQDRWFHAWGEFSGYTNRGYLKHECGTPACALGHWAAANKDRWVSVDGSPVLRDLSSMHPADSTAEDFCINEREHAELFGVNGCGDACDDGKKAAEYIREFVRRKMMCRGAE